MDSFCDKNSLDKALVKGKIIVCDSVPRHNEAQKAGAVGVIVTSISSKDVAQSFPLPITLLTLSDAVSIQSYLRSKKLRYYIYLHPITSNISYIQFLLAA